MASFSLVPDCSNCVAFCCVALTFDRGDHFAFDKNAGVPCPHLNDDHNCTIHANLKQMGFSGCVRYNCFGAGQRVTQDVFEGQSWRADPDRAHEMFEVFSIVEKLHGLISMLDAAKKLDLPPHLERIRQAQQSQLEQIPLAPEELKQLPLGKHRANVENFLTSLREEVSQSALRS